MNISQIDNSKRTRCEVYSRIVGYIRPVQQWNIGKKEEFSDRVTYDRQIGGNGGGMEMKCDSRD